MSMKTFAVMGFVGTALLVTGVGCGSSDDDKPAAAAGTPNKQSASSATTVTITAAQSALKPPPSGGGANDNGYSSATTLSSAAQACQNLVTPAAGGQTAQGLTADLATLLKPLENPSGTTGKCDCTADSCTFVACKSAALTIDGTYSFGGGKLKATGLKYTINALEGGGGAAAGFGTEVVITLDADMTATATSLDGTFHSTGTTTTSVQGQSYGSAWDSTLQFKAVKFPSGGGAATAGSVNASSTYTVNAGGGSQNYAGAFEVTFPAAK